jgi:hypothetical protein
VEATDLSPEIKYDLAIDAQVETFVEIKQSSPTS